MYIRALLVRDNLTSIFNLVFVLSMEQITIKMRKSGLAISVDAFVHKLLLLELLWR